MIKIGINLSLVNIPAGIGVYSKNLVKNLLKIDTKNQYFLFSPVDLEFKGKNVTFIKIKPFKTRYGRIFYENFYLHKEVNKLNLDVFHSPAFFLPGKINTKSIISVHDMVYKFFKHTIPASRTIYFNILMPRSFKKADFILTISNFTKSLILSEYPELKDKIQVIYINSGLDSSLTDGNIEFKSIMEKYNIKLPYLLFVSTIEPRKNLEGLLLALKDIENKNIHLVAVGNLGWKYKNVFNIINKYKLKDRITFTGSVSDNELALIYSNSEAFVYPSFYEGFGIPIIEAMKYGTPVITSGMGATKEVAKDAALFVNPYNPDSITNAINNLMSNPKMKSCLIKKGFQRAKDFSWEKAAAETLKVYEKTAAEKY